MSSLAPAAAAASQQPPVGCEVGRLRQRVLDERSDEGGGAPRARRVRARRSRPRTRGGWVVSQARSGRAASPHRSLDGCCKRAPEARGGPRRLVSQSLRGAARWRSRARCAPTATRRGHRPRGQAGERPTRRALGRLVRCRVVNAESRSSLSAERAASTKASTAAACSAASWRRAPSARLLPEHRKRRPGITDLLGSTSAAPLQNVDRGDRPVVIGIQVLDRVRDDHRVRLRGYAANPGRPRHQGR